MQIRTAPETSVKIRIGDWLSLAAKPLVYVDALQANSRPSWVDRFFETKREADGWSNAQSEFMMLRVIPPGSASGPTEP